MVRRKTLPQLNKIHQADALSFVRSLPNNSIDMVITSPPYWNLRDYGVAGQLGLEQTFQEYLKKLCDIFDEVKRVLKKEGTCWVNLGDTYLRNKQAGITGKSLCQIPARFAIEMCKRDWILRNEIVWHKPNGMPCSVKDRFTVDFEKLFFFSKSNKYFFKTQYEPYTSPINKWGGLYTRRALNEKNDSNNMANANSLARANRKIRPNPQGRNKRTVWSINTKSFKEAHFAVYPPELIETPIKAGCPTNGIVLDMFMGAGTTALVALNLNRQFLGCEINPAYIEIAELRLTQLQTPNTPELKVVNA